MRSPCTLRSVFDKIIFLFLFGYFLSKTVVSINKLGSHFVATNIRSYWDHCSF